jgi:MoaA/NifB/PqqE/SkfB family radical SAM enzyme
MISGFMERYGDYLTLQNLTVRKTLNACRYLFGGRRSAHAPHFPLYYMIEPGNVCRLRCPFCCQGHYASGVHSGRQMLPYEDFLVLLDKIRPYALILDLFKHGEPFLNPDTVRMIAAATAAGVRCRVNSTLNVDFQPTTARDIVRSGLYKLNCAIDGATQATYERYRVNGSLELAMRNAKAIIQARRDARCKHPLLIFRMLVFEWNHHEIEAARELAGGAGFDLFRADPGVFTIGGRTVVWDIESAEWRPMAWHRQSVVGGAATEAGGGSDGSCMSLFSTMVLHANGASMVCCHSSRKEWEQESLIDRSLAEVWNSPQYVRTRQYALRKLADASSIFPQCRGCCWI